MIVTTSVYIDLQNLGYPPLVNAVQNEQYSRQLRISLYSAGVAWPVPAGVYVAMRYSKPDGTKGYYDTMPDGSQAWSVDGNVVNIYVAPQMLTVPGTVLAQLEIIYNQSILATFPLRLKVTENLAEALQQSEDYVNWLQWMEDQLTQRWNDAAESGELIGPQGPVGPQGERGPQGIQGPIGPQGIQGQKGEKGDTGSPATIASQSVTYQVSDSGTIIPSGSWGTSIPVVAQGKYLWTRTTITYNTGSPVVSYSVSRMGLDGSGSVSKVNDISPDSNGNVTLTAADVDAMPTTGGTMTGAIAMGNKKITGLAEPTADADAATKKYVDTAVTGAKTYAAGLRVRNLLDNSDWRNPVAQAGLSGMHGNTRYVVDRWPIAGESSVTKASNGLIFNMTGFVYVYQKVEGVGGKTLTFAYKSRAQSQRNLAIYDSTVNNPIVVKTVSPVNEISTITYTIPTENDIAAFVIYPQDGEVIDWLALYEGAYTAETLPPYVPKGYTAELAECRRYYAVLSADNNLYQIALNGMITNSSKDIVVSFPVSKMRITPTASFTGTGIFRGVLGYIDSSGIGIDFAIKRIQENAFNVVAVICRTDGNAFSDNAVNNTPVEVSFTVGSKLELSADL